MKNMCRKGFSLMEVIAMLPVLAAVIVTGFQAVGWLVHAQAVEGRMLSNQAMMRDIVRRVQADARLAESAAVRRGEGPGVLELQSGLSTIVYRFDGAHVERVEQAGETAPVRYEWLLDWAIADVKHEAIGSSKGVVWMLFDCRLPMGERHEVNRHLTAAALVGEGGAS